MNYLPYIFLSVLLLRVGLLSHLPLHSLCWPMLLCMLPRSHFRRSPVFWVLLTLVSAAEHCFSWDCTSICEKSTDTQECWIPVILPKLKASLTYSIKDPSVCVCVWAHFGCLTPAQLLHLKVSHSLPPLHHASSGAVNRTIAQLSYQCLLCRKLKFWHL